MPASSSICSFLKPKPKYTDSDSSFFLLSFQGCISWFQFRWEWHRNTRSVHVWSFWNTKKQTNLFNSHQKGKEQGNFPMETAISKHYLWNADHADSGNQCNHEYDSGLCSHDPPHYPATTETPQNHKLFLELPLGLHPQARLSPLGLLKSPRRPPSGHLLWAARFLSPTFPIELGASPPCHRASPRTLTPY